MSMTFQAINNIFVFVFVFVCISHPVLLHNTFNGCLLSLTLAFLRQYQHLVKMYYLNKKSSVNKISSQQFNIHTQTSMFKVYTFKFSLFLNCSSVNVKRIIRIFKFSYFTMIKTRKNYTQTNYWFNVIFLFQKVLTQNSRVLS